MEAPPARGAQLRPAFSTGVTRQGTPPRRVAVRARAISPLRSPRRPLEPSVLVRSRAGVQVRRRRHRRTTTRSSRHRGASLEWLTPRRRSAREGNGNGLGWRTFDTSGVLRRDDTGDDACHGQPGRGSQLHRCKELRGWLTRRVWARLHDRRDRDWLGYRGGCDRTVSREQLSPPGAGDGSDKDGGCERRIGRVIRQLPGGRNMCRLQQRRKATLPRESPTMGASAAPFRAMSRRLPPRLRTTPDRRRIEKQGGPGSSWQNLIVILSGRSPTDSLMYTEANIKIGRPEAKF